MTTIDNKGEVNQKITNYFCELCDFKCSYNKDFQRHIITNKHKLRVLTTSDNDFGPKPPKPILKTYPCNNCEKIFNDRAGLWRHSKKCFKKEIFVDGINIKDKDSLVLHLLKQNSELQNKLIDIASKTTIKNSNNHNCNNTNIDNKTFNLQFFLNETCKDAMNITDFVSSIKVSLDDLEHTGKKGYIEGISNIIINKLNNLEQHFRPIHCSDYKREVFYIKENNKWQKETEDKPILTRAIKNIANENIKKIKCWQEKYPDCIEADSKKNNMFLKIVSNSMNGSTKEEGDKNINKIISNVAKEVIIVK